MKTQKVSRILTNEEKQWMCKAILNSKDLIVFQHEEDTLSMMYWKYATLSEIDTDELSDDMKFLENLAN